MKHRHRLGGPADPDFRPEIQGLRALAVTLVVVFHLWPLRLSGGYVGVDVFFVISGFLITSHLLREIDATGRVNVPRFWARRIRRLLPASFLVLAVAAATTVGLVPRTLWPGAFAQITASALYVENWALQQAAVDYLARDGDPTLVQHYWSLSVEEQFYVVWPLLLLLALLIHRRLTGRAGTAGRAHRAVAAALALVAASSLAASVILTARDQAPAYFSTFTRAWEFAAGALTALAAGPVMRRPDRFPAGARTAMGWLGLAAVVTAAAVLTERTAFPGWIATLPVLGTTAAVLAGSGSVASAGWWLSLRPATWLGDISYAVYLWHWPLITLAPYALGHVARWPDKLVVLALTLLLARASTSWIETPLRTGAWLGAAPQRAFAFAAAGMLVFTAGQVATDRLLEQRRVSAIAASAARAAAVADCLGPKSLDDTTGCRPVEGTGPPVVPAEVIAQESRTSTLLQRCRQTAASPELLTCVLGTTTGQRRTVAVLGDSHAAQWLLMLDEVGKRLGWKVVVHTKSACPMTLARRVLPDSETGHTYQLACEAFTRAAIADVVADPAVTDVFLAMRADIYQWTSVPGEPLADPAVDGFVAAWRRLAVGGRRLHLIADSPRPDVNVPKCLVEHPDDVLGCSTPRDRALRPDDQLTAMRSPDAPEVSVLDLTDRLCDDRWCYAQIGSMVVYRDANHVEQDYARLLAPYAIARLAGTVPS